MTPFHWDATLGGAAPDDHAHFSPRACRFGESFWLAPTENGARTCRMTTSARLTTPVLGECDLWAARLTAVHVLSHESIHLHGFYSEAHADCLGVQIDAYVAMTLGAYDRFARSLALEFWSDYYEPRRDAYRSSDCHEGGSLDLFPGRRGWPTPNRYPDDLAGAISALEGRVRAAGGSP